MAYINENKNDDVEINLNYFFNLIIRRKKILISLILSSAFLGSIYALIKPKIWQGEFQIIIKKTNEKNKISALNLNSSLSSLADSFLGGSKSNNIKTELEVLKSSSILNPIFKFVKESKPQNKNLKYKIWLNKFKFELKKGTSALTVTYKDKDKDFILPVLNKISSEYQKYSKRDRSIGLNQGIQYLSDQIEIYEEKSKSSFKKAQEYSYKYDLNPPSYIPRNIDPKVKTLDEQRFNASSELSYAKSLLKRFNNKNNGPEDIEKLIYISNSLIKNRDLILLKNLNSDIAKLKSIYKSNDILIKSKEQEKELFIISLVNEIKNKLLAKVLDSNAIIESISRPEGVLLSYKILMKDSIQDELILENIKRDFQILSIEKARQENPWELITNPTVLDNAVAPRKKLIVFYWLLTATFLAFIIAYILDKKSDLVYEISDFEKIFSAPIIFNINFLDLKNLDEFSILIKNQSKDNSLDILKISNISKNNLDTIMDNFQENYKKTKINHSYKLSSFVNSKEILVIIDQKNCTYNSIEALKSLILYQNIIVNGLIIVN